MDGPIQQRLHRRANLRGVMHNSLVVDDRGLNTARIPAGEKPRVIDGVVPANSQISITFLRSSTFSGSETT
jgi:hypothetical protein